MPATAYSRLKQDEELDAAFELEEEEEQAPVSQVQPASSTATVSAVSSRPDAIPTSSTTVTQPQQASYDFEREYPLNPPYAIPPPGSPPTLTTNALPNDIGNSNGLLPTEPIVRPTPNSMPGGWREAPKRWWRKAMGLGFLPSHYQAVPSDDSSDGPSSSSAEGRRRLVVGGGTENDGVFSNVAAKPSAPRFVEVRDETTGEVIVLPEDTQKDTPPTYATAAADSVPPYWDTTVLAPSGSSLSDPDGLMMIENLPPGSVMTFLFTASFSFFFQIMGFVMTWLMATTHAGRYGSRAGLGLTMIQWGFYEKSTSVWNGDQGDASDGSNVSDWSELTSGGTWNGTDGDPNVPGVGGNGSNMPWSPSVSSRDWISFLLMTIGWFLLLHSIIGFWRIKRWQSSILTPSAPRAPPTREEVEQDLAIRRNLESVFGIAMTDEEEMEFAQRREWAERAARASVGSQETNENESRLAAEGPSLEALEEARLARDLRAAGLL